MEIPDARPLRDMQQTVVPFGCPRENIASTTEVWSTLLVSSQNALRDCGHYPRYTAQIRNESHREALLDLLVGAWLPIDIAATHYRACDRLGLSRNEHASVELLLARPMKNLLLTTVSQVSKRFTLSPWALLGQLPYLWRRYFVGGGVAVYQEGPKDARVEYAGCTLATIPYFRRAFLLLVTQVARMLRNVAYVKEIPTRQPTSVVHCVAWV